MYPNTSGVAYLFLDTPPIRLPALYLGKTIPALDRLLFLFSILPLIFLDFSETF